MPTYEYKCTECDHTETLDFRLPDRDRLAHFPDSDGILQCSGKLKRVYSLGGISFKGSGFYKNDN